MEVLENTNIEVKFLSSEEFIEEWNKLFPLGDKELPSLLRTQAN